MDEQHENCLGGTCLACSQHMVDVASLLHPQSEYAKALKTLRLYRVDLLTGSTAEAAKYFREGQ